VWTVSAFLSLIRPASTVLIFLSVFLPLAAKTGDVRESLRSALPALFIAMCTFIVNDIDDVEADRVNHPYRPLPSGRLLASFATIFYFICLALALFTTRAFIPNRAAFFYYLLLILTINYKYIAEQFPNCKSMYVACVSSFPVLIVINLLEGARGLYLVATATFFFCPSQRAAHGLPRPGWRQGVLHPPNAAKTHCDARLLLARRRACTIVVFGPRGCRRPGPLRHRTVVPALSFPLAGRNETQGSSRHHEDTDVRRAVLSAMMCAESIVETPASKARRAVPR